MVEADSLRLAVYKRNTMIFVYVKHYLNEVGRAYFDDTWYPYVRARIQQEKGFVNIESSRDLSCDDCINITVTFENYDTLMAWAEHPDHKKVANVLDVYRTQGQRWHISVDGSAPDLALWDGSFFHNDTVNT